MTNDLVGSSEQSLLRLAYDGVAQDKDVVALFLFGGDSLGYRRP